jgi:hypothetical protein
VFVVVFSAARALQESGKDVGGEINLHMQAASWLGIKSSQ